MIATEFISYLNERKTIVTDGATGTNLQARGLPAGTAPETWLLEKPEEIVGLHKKFIQNGSDIILTCSFGGNRIRLAHAGLAEKIEIINQTAVQLARNSIEGKNVLVAGSIGPTGEMMEPYGTLNETTVFDIYRQQAKILIGAGVDLLVVETQFDLNEAKTAIQAIRSISEIALICSLSYDRGKRTMMGVKPEQVIETLADSGIQAIGVNCGKSLETNLEVLIALKSLTDIPIWFKPNAGAPVADDKGGVHYSISADEMGAQAIQWINHGAKFVGGCCGTSPEHLGAISRFVKSH